MGSDMAPEFGLIAGNSVSLMLHCSSEEEIRRCYDLLSAGGTASHPLDHTFWGAIFGGLTDKYGVLWLLNYNKDK
jgi:PhnB protein